MNELQIIKEYFPKSYNKIISSFQNTISEYNQHKTVVAEKDIELQNYIKENTQNLNIYVELVKDPKPDAFTIPSDIDINFNPKIENVLTRIPIIKSLYSIYSVDLKLLKANIDGYIDSDNKIIFTHNLPSNFILISYQSTGLKKLLKNDVEARFAIVLHEIGHWHNFHHYSITSLISMLSWSYGISTISTVGFSGITIIICVIVIQFLLVNYVKSINEANCDKFAKKLGYGIPSARAMFKLIYPKLKFDEEEAQLKLKQLQSTLEFKLEDFYARILNGYPSVHNRMATTINESILNLTFEIEFKNLLTKFDEFFNKIL